MVILSAMPARRTIFGLQISRCGAFGLGGDSPAAATRSVHRNTLSYMQLQELAEDSALFFSLFPLNSRLGWRHPGKSL